MATVPKVDGVPALPLANIAQQALQLMQYDTFEFFTSSQVSVWGIYRNGVPVISADTITDFTWRKEWVIADYHVERGAFESYDKVELPHETRIRFAAGGTRANREKLLRAINLIAPDLNLYDIVTPEITYVNCNVATPSYQRQPNRGNGLLQVDVVFREIRQTVAEAGSGSILPPSAALPSGASPQNGGTVQPQSLTAAEQLAAGVIPL